MAIIKQYSTSISVPIYTAWKCTKCGYINYSKGNIVCTREASTRSSRNSKNEEAKNKAQEAAQSEWLENALDIICEPQKHPQIVRSDLFLQYKKCWRCNKRPKWNRGTSYQIMSSIVLMITPIALISGFISIMLRTNIIAWLVFALTLGFFAFVLVEEKVYCKRMAEMPNEFLPVTVSSNEELVNGVRNRGKTMLTPEELIYSCVFVDDTRKKKKNKKKQK